MDDREKNRVLGFAVEVYGSRERALDWLKRPHPRLDGAAPASLLETRAGAARVEQLLGQIDEGYFV